MDKSSDQRCAYTGCDSVRESSIHDTANTNIEIRMAAHKFIPDDYVAWLRFDNGTIKVCDSDAPKAFRVYRRPSADLQEARQQLRERDALILQLQQSRNEELAAEQEAHAVTRARYEEEFDALHKAAGRDFTRQAERIQSLTSLPDKTFGWSPSTELEVKLTALINMRREQYIALQAQVQSLTEERDKLNELDYEARSQRNAAEARAESLAKYVIHRSDCPLSLDFASTSGEPCTCGLEAALSGVPAPGADAIEGSSQKWRYPPGPPDPPRHKGKEFA